jgi:hypothetical protein
MFEFGCVEIGIEHKTFGAFKLQNAILPTFKFDIKHIHDLVCKLTQNELVKDLEELVKFVEIPNIVKHVELALNTKSYNVCVNVNLFVIAL